MKRPTPGTSSFVDELLARLRKDSSAGAEVALESVSASSRNSLIYRVRADDAPLVCKADLGTRRISISREYGKLQELERRLRGTGVRSLVPVAVYPDLGVLVTREEPGHSVRHYIDRAMGASARSDERPAVEALMEPCAEALFRFHSAFGLHAGEGGLEYAASYMDFHPGNLLAAFRDGRPAVVMMDPPTREKERPVHWDIGTFCFGIARAGFTPHAILRLQQCWVDRLKAKFIAEYFRRLGRSATQADLERIQASERWRAWRALKRYAQFYRFRNWPREMARMAYFSPIVSAYVVFRLKKSYRSIAQLGS